MNRSRLNHEIDIAKSNVGVLFDDLQKKKLVNLPDFVSGNGKILMNEINIDFQSHGQNLKSFKFSNDKINAVLGLKDNIRKYIIDLLLKKQEGE